MEPRFVVDTNVGKLAKWLRIMGYDALFPRGADDDELVRIGLREKRVVLTRDTHILKRRVATTGQLRAILINGDNVREQIKQVVRALNLGLSSRAFSLCINCNRTLQPKAKEEVRSLVPPYVFQTKAEFMECPSCHKIYWQGTHWQRMEEELTKIKEGAG
ncbi:MAG: Mut7-C RNAse domain-containing protein [Chloroflexi bacterium]|nr:Mut7-C RNAse domain-containing protein [Chloroflexota bacterium]